MTPTEHPALAFLDQVLTQHEGDSQPTIGGWLRLNWLSPDGGQLWDQWMQWPQDRDNGKLVEWLIAHIKDNVYFSPHLYLQKGDSRRDNLSTTRTFAADLDDADLEHLPIVPAVVVRTSEDHHQAYWITKDNFGTDVIERLARNMTYAVSRSDRTGWLLGRPMRLPGTLNSKYAGPPQEVIVLESRVTKVDMATLEMLPIASEAMVAHFDNDFVNNPPTTPTTEQLAPQELLEQLRRDGKITGNIQTAYNTIARDKPKAIWSLATALFRAGLEREVVFYLLVNCRNNYFAGMRIGGDRELAKEILRAEALVKTRSQEPFDIVQAARKSGGGIERKQHIKAVVISLMKQDGAFIRTDDERAWYVRRDTGRPILLERNSQVLEALLNMYYGLNATESDFNFVEQDLIDYGQSLPTSGIQARLSYYDSNTNELFIHTGKREVVHITTSAINRIVNGSNNVVFPWGSGVDPFAVDLNPDFAFGGRQWWSDILFKDSLINVVNMPTEEAQAVLTAWFMFVMLRHAAQTRPILAMFGSPGSGKTFLFKKIFAILFGRGHGLQALSSSENFDHMMATEALVVLDNLDTWERWLPDRLALSAGTSDIHKRTLWTNSDITILKRQAVVALTAHNPQFSRPDVADRLLIINLERRPDGEFGAEGPIHDRVMSLRHQIMGGVALDLQRVLNTPIPNDALSFRIEDFARIGAWATTAIGMRAQFDVALNRIKASQRHFSLEEENLFVEAMESFLRFKKGDTGWLTPSQLWTDLLVHSRDQTNFSRTYRNAPSLSRRLVAMREPLRTTITIESKMSTSSNTRNWRFTFPADRQAKAQAQGQVKGQNGTEAA